MVSHVALKSHELIRVMAIMHPVGQFLYDKSYFAPQLPTPLIVFQHLSHILRCPKNELPGQHDSLVMIKIVLRLPKRHVAGVHVFSRIEAADVVAIVVEIMEDDLFPSQEFQQPFVYSDLAKRHYLPYVLNRQVAFFPILRFKEHGVMFPFELPV
jgi:hypothetical protein